MIHSWSEKSLYNNCECCCKPNPHDGSKMHTSNGVAFRNIVIRDGTNTHSWWLCDDCLLKYQW
jgi:hypothetical protein